MSVATESGTFVAPSIRQTGILIGDEWRPAVSGKNVSDDQPGHGRSHLRCSRR